MAEPISIRVERPYQDEETFLDAEAWSVTARSVLLIGVAPVPEGTTLRCELRLESGRSLLVAEGVAVKHLSASSTRPAGLVVRYKRMSAASSDFVKRAVARTSSLASQPDAASAPQNPPPHERTTKPPRSERPSMGRRSSRPSPAASAEPLSTGSASTRPSKGPPSAPAPRPKNTSTRPPSSAKSPSTAPRGMSAHGDLEAPAARSVSVVPKAKRVSTIPPEAPTRSAFTKSVRPAAERADTSSPESALGAQEPVPSSSKRRDSGAMQRLRSRVPARTISAPPDREAILSRLKKPPKKP